MRRLRVLLLLGALSAWRAFPALAVEEFISTAILRAKYTNVDGKTTGTTTLFTLPADWIGEFYVTEIVLIAEDVAGFATGPTVSFGSNADGNDTVAASAVTAPGGTYAVFAPKMFSTPIAASGVFKVNVTVASTSFTYKFKVFVFGVQAQSYPE